MRSDFLLPLPAARELYTGTAADLPVIDFHNHLSVPDILAERRFLSVTDLWLKPDPYKHRAMRMRGVPEKYITGDAPEDERFRAWCTVFPDLVGNPLYSWSLMELSSVFGIGDVPCADNADSIRMRADAFLASNDITPAWFFRRFGVERACPCMALTDDLSPIDPEGTAVPSLRADATLVPNAAYAASLAASAGRKIGSLADYLEAASVRVRAFCAHGCRFADHGLDDGFAYVPDDGKNAARFDSLLAGQALSAPDRTALSSFILRALLGIYAACGMHVQLHIGAVRSTSTRLRTLAGAAGGFAASGRGTDFAALARLFDDAERDGALPRIILFPLNPADNAGMSVLCGSFSADGVPGLITQGPAWWWCDHRYGMECMLESFAASGLLSCFTGMTTDSRSFLSLVRHDYFRRVLCSFLARKAEENDYPADSAALSRLVRMMCYENAADAFGSGNRSVL